MVQVVSRREGEGGGGVKKREEEVGPAPHTQRRRVEGFGGERWEGTFQVETLWDPARDTPANFPQSFSPECRRKGSIPRHSVGTQLLQSGTGTVQNSSSGVGHLLVLVRAKETLGAAEFFTDDFRKHAFETR